jgi:Clp amino terminal domain, pathogenicity island component
LTSEVIQLSEPAHRVLELAREEAERCGHRYLGPEHVLLGVLTEGHSAAARVLQAYGVDLGLPGGECLAGARWAAQNILQRYQNAQLQVYVVWVKRWALDTRDEIDGAGMIDPRVTHLWDAGNIIDQGFLDQFGVYLGGLDYDFFLLFDRDATWGPTPPRPVSSGATVIGDSDRLANSAATLLR